MGELIGTTLYLPKSAEGKTVELQEKVGRRETKADIMMWVGVKTDPTSGEMKGQVRAVRHDTLYKKFLNTIKSRRTATEGELRMHCQNRGMTPDQIDTVFSNVTMHRGKAYMAKSFMEEVNKVVGNHQKPAQEKNTPENQKEQISWVTLHQGLRTQ